MRRRPPLPKNRTQVFAQSRAATSVAVLIRNANWLRSDLTRFISVVLDPVFCHHPCFQVLSNLLFTNIPTFDTMPMRSALFWDFTPCRMVIPYWRRTTSLPHLQESSILTFFFLNAWLLKIGRIGCPETSVRNYNSTLHKIPKERRSQLRHRGSLKSPVTLCSLSY